MAEQQHAPGTLAGEVEARETFRQVLERQAQPGSAITDPYLRVASLALSQLLEEDPLVQETYHSYHELRPTIPPAYSWRIWMIGAHRSLIRERVGRNYPHDDSYKQPGAWRQHFHDLADPDSSDPRLHDDFLFDITTRSPQSAVGQRYVSFAAAIGLMPERLGEDPHTGRLTRFIDEGAGPTIGSKQLVLAASTRKDAMPFKPVTVMRKGRDHQGQVGYVEDPRASEKMNTIINSSKGIANALCIDNMPARDPATHEWVKAGSYNPVDVANGALEQHHQFEAAVTPQVHFYEGDITALDHAGLQAFLAEKRIATPADAAFYSMVLYQQSPDGIQSAFDNIIPYVKDDGFLIINDFARAEGGNRNQLTFYDDWYGKPWRCRTLALDLSDPNGEFLEVFVWQNGRGTTMRLGKDFHRLPRSGPLKEIFSSEEIRELQQ